VNWETVKLGDVATIERDQMDPRALTANVQYLGLENIEAGGRIIESRTVGKGDLASAKFRFTPDHILYGKLRPYLAKISLPEFEGICSTDILPVKPGPNLDRQYLAYFLRQPEMVEYANSRTTGANLPRLSPKVLADFDVPFPELSEQRRIAAILSKAEKIRRNCGQIQVIADALLHSAFLHMFGEPISNPLRWPQGVIGDCLTGIAGGWSANGDSRSAAADEMGVLKISAVTTGEYIPSENKMVSAIPEGKQLIIPQAGDLLFSRANTRELVAATCLVLNAPQNVFLPDKLWRLDVNREVAEPAYLKCVLSNPEYRHLLCARATGTSGSMLNISKAKLINNPILIPPIDRQRSFAALWQSVRLISSERKSGAREAEALFDSLSQRAFRGEL
jgi:type I restriction enzyme, S subunit